MLKKLKKEIDKNRFTYFLLATTLVLGLVVRVYRVGEILGFYFDQGRDALVIWDLWHKGNFFLIGPTTGIAGIFRGPLYYYLIAPFYLIGGGNPVWPAVFLAITSMVAVALLFYLGYKVQDRATGLFAAIIGSFSFYIVFASRWLSNPTPMLLLSVLLLWMMLLVHSGRKWAWPVIAFIAGSSLFHFGSAGELFYFGALFVFLVWQIRRKNLPGKRYIQFSLLAFLVTILPLIIFDIRNNLLLSTNIKNFLFGQESFKTSLMEVAGIRFPFYYDVFASKIFHNLGTRETALLSIVVGFFVVMLPELWKKDSIKISILLFMSPIIGLLFFQGNFGNIYDYYLTGYYLIFILIFAVVLGKLWKFLPGKLFVFYFLFVFLTTNGDVVHNRITAGVDGPNTVAFGNQKQAIDWIYENVGNEEFNVDVYVPPVIPHAYDYLLKWYGGSIHGREPEFERVPLLYTLYEVDPPHPERLEAWLERQKGIGEVEEEESFGGITVQRRKRH